MTGGRTLWDQAEEAAAYIRRAASLGEERPDALLVLGSGLGELAEEVEGAAVLPYGDIPHFPRSTVEGHAGRLVVGRLGGRLVLVMQGRFHYYEGYSLREATFGLRAAQRLGVPVVILTNAAGGLDPAFEPGDLMLITDHINLIPDNPLRGPNDPRFGPRFPSPVGVYDRGLLETARRVAARAGFACREGVYVALPGPSYETEAEVRFLRLIGADAVGMSTVPEALVAAHGGQRVLAVSTITNVLGREPGQVVTHEEVLAVAERVKSSLRALVLGVLGEGW
ncbi:MAG: purine-nucleoside phosphorylase [Firmicutes bacterium]|nr:purine-nucleoside phosphorylase [Bacillota bacterium]